jgi:hypothetical protein
MQNIVIAEVGTTDQADQLLRFNIDVVRSTSSSASVKVFPLDVPTSI